MIMILASALENYDFMSWEIAPEVISSVIITVLSKNKKPRKEPFMTLSVVFYI